MTADNKYSANFNEEVPDGIMKSLNIKKNKAFVKRSRRKIKRHVKKTLKFLIAGCVVDKAKIARELFSSKALCGYQ